MGFRGYLNPQITYLFKDSCKELIIRNPNLGAEYPSPKKVNLLKYGRVILAPKG